MFQHASLACVSSCIGAVLLCISRQNKPLSGFHSLCCPHPSPVRHNVWLHFQRLHSAVCLCLQVDELTAAAQEAEAASVYEDEYIEFDPYLFIRKLPPLDAVVPASRVALLPRQVPDLTRRGSRFLRVCVSCRCEDRQYPSGIGVVIVTLVDSSRVEQSSCVLTRYMPSLFPPSHVHSGCSPCCH